MSAEVEYLTNKASAAKIDEHLWKCDIDFVPPLSSRVNISNYAQKIFTKAMRFEAWSGGILIGLVAIYCNNQENHIAYVTSVSVIKEWVGMGIAGNLVSQCIKHMDALGMKQICLEVASGNIPAIKLYEKCGFVVSNPNALFITMSLFLKSGEDYEQQA